MFLANFNYTVHHRPGKFNLQADALSGSPKPEVQELDAEVSAIQQEHISWGLADAVHVQQATRFDAVHSRVVDFVLSGWPAHNPGDEFQPWWSRREKLTVESGVLLWGSRVVVPTPLRQKYSSYCTNLILAVRAAKNWPGVTSGGQVSMLTSSSKSATARHVQRIDEKPMRLHLASGNTRPFRGNAFTSTTRARLWVTTGFCGSTPTLMWYMQMSLVGLNPRGSCISSAHCVELSFAPELSVACGDTVQGAPWSCPLRRSGSPGRLKIPHMLLNNLLIDG